MAQVIKPNQVKILTQDGEVKVSITLELNINLNTDQIKIAGTASQEHKIEKEADYLVPDFTSQIIEFGKEN